LTREEDCDNMPINKIGDIWIMKPTKMGGAVMRTEQRMYEMCCCMYMDTVGHRMSCCQNALENGFPLMHLRMRR
jgi:hypothetical protein